MYIPILFQSDRIVCIKGNIIFSTYTQNLWFNQTTIIKYTSSCSQLIIIHINFWQHNNVNWNNFLLQSRGLLQHHLICYFPMNGLYDTEQNTIPILRTISKL
jgi:hypothetical protein